MAISISQRFLFLVIGVVLFAGNLHAETVRRDTGGGDTVRKAQYMLRQLSQENTQLKSEKARLASDVEALNEKMKKLEKGLNAQLDASRASNDRLTARVGEDSEKIRALIEKYRDAVDLLRMEKANVAHLKNAVIERNHWIGVCKKNNGSLMDLNTELVHKFENKGLWQTLSQADPLTGIGEVKVEVIADDYIYRIEDLQVADFKEGKRTDQALR